MKKQNIEKKRREMEKQIFAVSRKKILSLALHETVKNVHDTEIYGHENFRDESVFVFYCFVFREK